LAGVTKDIVNSSTDMSGNGHREIIRTSSSGFPRTAHPEQNLLLAKLPANDRARLLPDLELVHLELGSPPMSLAKSSPTGIPTDSVISLLYTTEEGWSTEIAAVLLMGGRTTSSIAVVLWVSFLTTS
jgi:hypothetical protein